MRVKISLKNLSPPSIIGRRLAKAFESARAAAQAKIALLLVDRASEKADKMFRSLAPVYKKALTDPRAVTVTRDAVTIQLRDPIALALDSGSSAFDLKRKLLSKSTKTTKDGRPYVDIPFQHKASTVPRLTRARMALSAALGTSESVRNAVVTPGAVFDRQLMKRGEPTTTQRVAHQRGIHDDLIRSSTKTSSRKSSVSHTTIRRISERSSMTSWWHPGFRGTHLLKSVVAEIKPDIIQIMRDSLRGLPSK